MDTREPQTVLVWDIAVRIFHAVLIVAFVTAWLTAGEIREVHEIAGYTILVLVCLRIVWGFVGSRHARFSDFVRSPRAAIDYLKALKAGNPPHYLGHNPAGGWMVLALLGCLLTTTLLGLQVAEIKEAHEMAQAAAKAAQATMAAEGIAAPEAAVTGHAGHEGHHFEPPIQIVHEIFAYTTLALVCLHLLGVAVGSWRHRENLPRAMVTGRKRIG